MPVGALFKQIFENACCNRRIPDPPPPPVLKADLAITELKGQESSTERAVHWTGVLKNNGPNTAKNAALKLTFSTDPPGGTVTPSVQTQALGDLAVGESRSFSFKMSFVITGEGSVTFKALASVTSSSEDNNPSNNSRQAKIKITIIG
jgi:hypothetical protein